LLSTESQARQWLDSFKGTKVLKTCYGVSGKGHLIIESDAYPQDRITSFLVKEWAKDLPVIAEPWVTRILDFSTQWSIDKHRQITYLGSTICNNDERGQYRFNLVGDEQILFTSHLSALKEHKKIVEQLMQKIALMGFFGNVGVDAMLYSQSDNPDRIYLHPVVEINARKTMGWAALQIQHRYFPNQTIRFQYATGNEGYLPDFVESKQGKKIRFSRNLTIEQMLFTI
jgi:hypothetical protein